MKKPNLWISILSNKCPRCRKGNLFITKNPYHFKKLFAMPVVCPTCGQLIELETGFWFGTGYVSYALAVALSGLNFVLFYFLFGFSWQDNSPYWFILFNAIILILCQPPLMRWSRTAYLYLFVKYDKDAIKI